MQIGVVVHGPFIVDSGYALKLIRFLKEYGDVKARLGGTMGRTAVIDAKMEDLIDISNKRLPSESIDKFQEECCDLVFLINSGKSCITGHAFGYKVFKKSITKPLLIQIERPGEIDGCVIPWRKSLRPLAKEIAIKMNLKLVYPREAMKEISIGKNGLTSKNTHKNTIHRKLVGVSPNENIFLNGIVIGRSSSDEVILTAKNGIITEIKGGKLKIHGVEKLDKIDLNNAVVKTGLLRRSIVNPRITQSRQFKNKFIVAFLNHAAEDIYRLKDADMVVAVGDDTTLVAADILYRFDVPIIGITDGDVDQVVEKGFKSRGSMIIELESGWDDIIGEKIFSETFGGEEMIVIEDIENFKKEILQIIDNTAVKYFIKENEIIGV
ncbi:MAG: DUF2117 domain-containing protein [Methanobacteriaceae archaeon]|nr:DUF2117 domain-containing protein [Methanobacteriaceae archaeon]MDZ4172318.1 DUF2117 domain-containing protein [Methanobacteriaceae archaeon]